MLVKYLKEKNIVISLLMAIFLICQTIVLVHSFSHKITSSEKGFSNSENNFVKHAFFFHDKNSKKSENESCSLFIAFSLQQQLLFYNAIIIAFSLFYFSFIKRTFDKVKLSYLISSYFGRAPPKVFL